MAVLAADHANRNLTVDETRLFAGGMAWLTDLLSVTGFGYAGYGERASKLWMNMG